MMDVDEALRLAGFLQFDPIVQTLAAEVLRLRTQNERMLQQHADEVMALDRVRALVESDRDVDGNVGILPRWSSTEIERALEGRA